MPRGEPMNEATGGAPRSVGPALDWFNLFVANIQTGFGPFIAVYLTTQGWTQTAIGLALSVGTISAMASQVPAGALVDAARRKSVAAALSVLAFTLSALIFALWPAPLFVYLAEVLHGFSSCTLGPAIAAMSLALAGRASLGLRLGRNARYASIGSGIGAALMGACGYYVSNQAIFYLTAALTVPALLVLRPLSRLDDWGGREEIMRPRKPTPVMALLSDRRLLIFAGCAMLFTLANAGILPIASTYLTKRLGAGASLMIAACIVLPQMVVAVLSPQIGRFAEMRGRRRAMLLGFLALPVKALLFVVITNPYAMVLVQALDGLAAASFGVMVPLITSDVAGRSGHFNLSLGIIGLAIGVGGTLGTPLAGWLADDYGGAAAFAGLALIGILAFLLVWGAMPETRPVEAARASSLTR
jgi:MFS family permease